MKKLLLSALLLICCIGANAQIISTIAGNGLAGYSGDGVAATATSLNTPYGVGMDSIGNIYIGDANNNRVRIINTSGIINTVAGTGTAGFNGDGLAPTATQFNFPYGMAVDRAGTIMIADRSNHRVRCIQTEAGGVVFTIAGTGVPGFSGDGGPGVSAQVYYPQGAIWDQSGDVYFCDGDNHRVRKISGGVITTVAGNGTPGFSGDGGPATAASLHLPAGITKDSAGYLYIADYSNQVIRRVDPSGTITTICGSPGTIGFGGDGGPASSALLNYPKDVFADRNGNVFVTDADNQRIRKINAAGIINTVAGNGVAGFFGDGGAATNAKLNYPQQIFVDTAGNIYIGDCLNHRIRKVSCPTPVIGALTGPDTVCIGSIITLSSITPGGVWVSSNGNATIAGGVVTGVSAGWDTVKYVVSNACTSTYVTRRVYVSTCVPTAISNITLPCVVISPNPASDEVVITAPVVIRTVVITSMDGRALYTKEFSSNRVSVNVSDLPAGAYLVKINGSGAGRFVKQ